MATPVLGLPRACGLRLFQRRLNLCLIASFALAGFPAVATAEVRVVTKDSVPYEHHTTIQAAVDAAQPGDWVLIDGGTYPESVYVDETKDGLHIRGMDRNGVVLDGEHRHHVNGIEVYEANDVTIENLTVHDFDREDPGGHEGGNQIWWNGGYDEGEIGAYGWYGRYLTTYSTGLNGGYGLFTNNYIVGEWEHVYASGFNDSGIYIGACKDCFGRVSDALVENNALGYSGTNSGGHLVIEDSVFRRNSNGIGPNSLAYDDPPPPQNGSCDSRLNDDPTPEFPTTRFRRCTIFRDNLVADNGNLTTPANPTTAMIPWGNGFVLIGAYADRVEGNTIRDNPSTGVLGFENPNPLPPGPETIYFQIQGNKIAGNMFSGNGTGDPASPFAGDVTLEGGLLGETDSVNNCVSGNEGLATSWPPLIELTYSCLRETTPNPGGAALPRLLQLMAESMARDPVPQPVPPPQPAMPDPCAGVPPNPLCE